MSVPPETKATRSSKQRVVTGLQPVKRKVRNDSENVLESVSPPTTKKLRSMSSPPPSTSRSRFVYGRECGICHKYELVQKKKGEKIRSYPQHVTLEEAARKIKESAKVKDTFSDLYLKIKDQDLIAVEFKCHNECRIRVNSVREGTCLEKRKSSWRFYEGY